MLQEPAPPLGDGRSRHVELRPPPPVRKRRRRGAARSWRAGRIPRGEALEGVFRASCLAGPQPRWSTPARTATSSRPGPTSRPSRDLAGRGRGLRRYEVAGLCRFSGRRDAPSRACGRPAVRRAAPGSDRLPPRRRAGGVTERAAADEVLGTGETVRAERSCSRSPTGVASGR